MAYSLGGDGARFASILTQHIKGDQRQFAVIQTYKFIGEDVNGLYESNLYANVLFELNRMKKIATEKGYNHYNGICKTLEAYTLLFVADFWNSAPYSEAFQGAANLQPKFDTQAELYTTIFTLLDGAKTDLQASAGALKPGTDDLIYGGNIPSWLGFVNFIKARANLHLAKKDPSKYADALAALTAGGLVKNAAISYDANNSNPMYQFNEQRGDCSLGGSLKDMVTTLNDPRKALYDQPFTDANTFITPSKSVVLASITEQNFIKAECNFKISGASAAHQNYLDGINSSLTGYGISTAAATTYLGQSSVDPGASSLTLDHIMKQKYIALFMDPEVFTDWRRTGIPALTPNNGSVIPRRFPYPQQELNLNPNTPKVTIYSPVDWDN